MRRLERCVFALAWSLVVGGLWSAPPRAHADGMRCGKKLVVEGDFAYLVRARCGDPDATQRRSEYRTERVWVAGRALERVVEVAIEEWTYDFGPHQFIRHLIFEQGRLVAVITGRRGEKPDNEPAEEPPQKRPSDEPAEPPSK